MKNIKWIIGILVVIILVVVLSNGGDKEQSAQQTEGPIKIGFIGPLTGDVASLGENALIAAQLAVDEINANGGINDRTVELIAEDGSCSGKEASSAAQKLISIDKVVGIIGGLCSSESSAFTGILNQSETPGISYCSSAATLSDAGDYFFRTYPSDAYQGVFAANYLRNEKMIDKVAVLYVNDDWGAGLKQSFIDTFKNLGGEVVLEESFEKDERDFRTQLLKAQASGANLIYYLGFDQGAVSAIKQRDELNVDLPMFGADPWDDMTIWNDVASISEGFGYTVPHTTDSQSFTSKMADVGVSEVSVCASQSYDTMNIFAQVIGQVGTNGSDIKDALYDVQYQNGISSQNISFDENGDLVGAEYVVKTIQDGQVVEL